MGYAEILTAEEIDMFISAVRKEKGEDYSDELLDELTDIKRELPKRLETRKRQLALFKQLRPDRCGTIDLEHGDVKYNEEKYTYWNSNYPLDRIEEHLFILDYVGLDYELRLADLYDASGSYALYIPDDPAERQKYAIAGELDCMYYLKHGSLIKEGKTNALSKEELKAFLDQNFSTAYYKAVQSVFSLEFKKEVDDFGNVKKRCIAKMDELHLDSCRKNGFRLANNVNIPKENFGTTPVNMDEINGIKVYTLEFYI